ncbi:hypothetical protein A3G67_04315 [Candidatus Roizmanbacteria bacterium RIFCSPLOWO2_12_FULL_40_12]|uniref:UDP-N-acetylglucosamine--N-acetylmuramyl-(pentapeptide) pyrophosphoryl-undecaprenol N-acetylglucosamine transferase n=1 Tax=Candidatus Roizmanbacteria bacterium RIFCSPLOWO2_01_FULL_40_42 TaxID=1802066 RepID=A0A1F7J4V0_9BACT|nr:MAG: hypothetical protein A2779_04835 [Candidatus Roizmanbacteria bacterium RIFCSPHIGHO2_01_FULL_40_98]OGK27397.1 MAG: hypothetical protein A3C31_05160 [Candidatus Roizmanbacteria bacterium RIFCSPHIGHO2_02_FULL_40_53]OGK30730.1 MAG: hypothetical protein A2W49_01880 [Candidatus Roizmanbacteria bacterium RIFCSPHIGHO2_12_41_18]OGK36180.1 MAG: hypothetical protein A3E69_01360 [Candidatus Roizmanbacteria bacterium RIFCSPHIGHO2_12_FULL_40_130]OGK50631.1 MAG: hypothetical protein A3B50_02515 [Candi
MKILITGGHVTPALAVIEELRGHELVFVGRKYALEQEQTLSFEFKEIAKRKVKFIPITTGRSLSFLNLFSFFKIPFGFYQAYKIIREEKPDIVLTFGSYLAVPIACWARIFDIPVYLHEQTSIPGKATKFIGKFAKKIFISFPETKTYFPSEKVRLTGNPIRKAVSLILKKPFPLQKEQVVLYVTGGSLGSHSINQHIENLLARLLKKYTVIHQVGDTRRYNDFERLLEKKSKLPEELKNQYFVFKHFSEEEVGYVYSLADVVVGRAGANTFFELVSLEKPAVFIPLPWSAEKEQQKQAKIFKDAGVGEIFNQTEKSENLLSIINAIFQNLAKYKSNFRNLKKLYKENAARTIAKEILKN